MTSWESLGRQDPAPGHVGPLRGWAATADEISSRALTSHKRMTDLDVQGWSGDGATRYLELKGPVADEILDIHTAHLKARAALEQHVSLLGRLQERANRLLDRYVDAQQQQRACAVEVDRCRANRAACEGDLRTARMRKMQAETRSFMGLDADQQYWNQQVEVLESDNTRWGNQEAAAASQRSRHEAEIGTIESEAQSIRRLFESSAHAAADAIAAAVGESVASRNAVIALYDRAVDQAELGAEAAGDVVSSDVFAAILESLDDVAAGLSIAAMCIPFFPHGAAILKGFALGISVVSAIGKTARALNTGEGAGGVAMAWAGVGATLALPALFGASSGGGAKGAAKFVLGTDKTAGYLKQAARYGRAGGRWSGPAGRLIEKQVHVVPVLQSTVVRPEIARFAFGFTGGTQLLGTGRDAVSVGRSLRAFVADLFDD